MFLNQIYLTKSLILPTITKKKSWQKSIKIIIFSYKKRAQKNLIDNGVQTIVVSEIRTQLHIDQFQVNYVNTLLYQVNVIYYPGFECGILRISIDDLTLKGALLTFTLISAG